MNPIANHRTGIPGKQTARRAWETGALLAPEHPLQVPVLTTSQGKSPLLVEIMRHDPLFYFDKRPEKQWSSWLKVVSASYYASKFKKEGHEHFLYLDSDDGFLWRSFTNEECKEFLGGKAIRFQRGYRGLCAGCYVARTDAFSSFAKLLENLKDSKSPEASLANEWVFCDQEAWNSLYASMPDLIGVEENPDIITHMLLGKEVVVPKERKSEGLGDTVKKVTEKLGIPQCNACKKRQKKLNRLFPYKPKTKVDE